METRKIKFELDRAQLAYNSILPQKQEPMHKYETQESIIAPRREQRFNKSFQ